MNLYYTYDLEAYPNCFLFAGKFHNSTEVQQFEISDRVNQKTELLQWLGYLRNCTLEMVGFNNIGYDYYLIHELMTNQHTFTYQRAHELNNQIITGQKRGVKFDRIKFSDRLIPQIDMMKVCHFDNENRRTSLKALQFAMRTDSLEDLPFKIRPLTNDEKDRLRDYNVHDVLETEKFFLKHIHVIDMRREYLNDGVLFGDVLNYSDVKIGVEYLISRIGRNKCFNGGKPKQTFRTIIEYNKIILPKIFFRTDEYQDVLSWFKKQVIYLKSEEDKPKLEAVKLAGLDFYFGVGGVHASRSNKIYESNETHQIIDIDVAGMYVAVGIANRFAPEHLGEAFIHAYKQIKDDRAKYPKGSSRNAALKLAGNGAYGNSNNPFSPLYDTQYTYSVTINGQLQILQLVELIDLIPECEMIQANTDGITVLVKREYKYLFDLWCREWEKMTGLELEEVPYKKMWIRDVNNYIAQKENGSLKLKGDYWYPSNDKDYEGYYNKDYSNLASKKAVEKAMVNSWPLSVAIRLITDPFDFMLRYKATGDSQLFIGEEEQLKTVRYYVSISGKPMKKISSPKGEIGQYKRKSGLKDDYFNKILSEIGKDKWDERIHTKNKSKYAMVETSIQEGWLVKECNRAEKFDWNDVDWKYYIEEAEKLIIGSK